MGAMVIMIGWLVGYTAAVGGCEPGRIEAVFVGIAGLALCICVLGKNWTENDNRYYPVANSPLSAYGHGFFFFPFVDSSVVPIVTFPGDKRENEKDNSNTFVQDPTFNPSLQQRIALHSFYGVCHFNDT